MTKVISLAALFALVACSSGGGSSNTSNPPSDPGQQKPDQPQSPGPRPTQPPPAIHVAADLIELHCKFQDPAFKGDTIVLDFPNFVTWSPEAGAVFQTDCYTENGWHCASNRSYMKKQSSTRGTLISFEASEVTGSQTGQIRVGFDSVTGVAKIDFGPGSDAPDPGLCEASWKQDPTKHGPFDPAVTYASAAPRDACEKKAVNAIVGAFERWYKTYDVTVESWSVNGKDAVANLRGIPREQARCGVSITDKTKCTLSESACVGL